MICTRRIATLLLLGTALTGCSLARKMGFKDDVPGHKEPKSTSIYGDWVLATPDSTAFAGSTLVELHLQRSSFIIRAAYPNEATPQVITGTAQIDSTGLLTLVPTSGAQRTGGNGPLMMVVGRPVTLIASAAGGTLLFKPPHENVDPTPSSVWHKKSAATAAGKVSKKQTSAGEVERKP
jgi:hypothetical protein